MATGTSEGAVASAMRLDLWGTRFSSVSGPLFLSCRGYRRHGILVPFTGPIRGRILRGRERRLSRAATVGLGLAELLASASIVTGIFIQIGALVLLLLGLGAIGKKVFRWKTGFWGEKGYGWHYDLLLLAMNLVVLCSAGGKLVLTR